MTLCQNLTYFFSDVLAIARTKKPSTQYVTKFVVFSTICKLCPGDFQAILFWFDIVPESNLIFLRMSWRSQGHTKQVHNISQKFVVFSTICKLRPGDFQAILFWCDIVPKFHLFFFRCPGDRKDKKYLVHNMSLNLLFFSTICKLCPGDFQAILFWCDIVAKFLSFFFRCPGDRKDIQSKCTIFHKNLLFFQLFVNFVLAISRPFYFGLTLCLNLT